MANVIYITTNLINGKKYIGKTSKDCESYLGSGILLKIAIKKYGVHNFKKEVLEECDNLSELNEREFYWISKYDAVNSDDFYNLMEGGQGGDTFTPHPFKDDIRKRISSGTSKWMMGRKHSKETIEKIRESNTGIKKNPHTDEWKELVSSKLTGKSKPPRSEEHKLKLSESHKGQVPHNKGTFISIPDDILSKINEDRENGKSFNKLSNEYGYSVYIIKNNINKQK